jgi:hypothetical protein
LLLPLLLVLVSLLLPLPLLPLLPLPLLVVLSPQQYAALPMKPPNAPSVRVKK